MKRLETFDFNIGDKVIINEVQRPGKIEALRIDFLGVQYLVGFWDNSQRQSAWLGADELSNRN